MITGIYTITNSLNNKRYVGFSNNIDKRLGRHIQDLNKNKHHSGHLQDSWNKYGKDNFLFETLIECEERFLPSEEHYWATMLNVHNPEFGYNVRSTHPEGKNRQTENTKNKIALSNTGKTRNLEQKVKMSNSAKNKFSNGFIVWNKGKQDIKVSEITKLKIKQTMLNKKLNTNNGVGFLRRRAVLQYSLDGILIKEWESLTEASLYFSGNKCSAIHKVCNGKQKVAYKYYWKWKD
jgi:group I intron endonuclease